MPSFNIPVREHGKSLGETEVSIPELAFVPEAALHLVDGTGAEQPLLGWGGRLWAPVRGPDGAPLATEAFAALARAKSDPDPFSDRPFASPFEPNRFAHPLAVPDRARRPDVLKARPAEIAAIATDLAVIGGHVHRAVPEPVLRVQMAGPGGANATVNVRCDRPGPNGGDPGWDVFRADRPEDAEAFARSLAARSGGEFLGVRSRVRIVYDALLARDDVHAAFTDAFDRFGRLVAEKGTVVQGGATLAAEAGDALGAGRSPGRFEDLAAAEEARSVLDRIREALAASPGLAGDMHAEAVREVADLVALRYDDLDRAYLSASSPSLKA
jgi:hypothetical protein